MNLKTIAKLIYMPTNKSRLRHVTIIKYNENEILWEGTAVSLQDSNIVEQGLYFIEILIDRNMPGEDDLPYYEKSIIISVI